MSCGTVPYQLGAHTSSTSGHKTRTAVCPYSAHTLDIAKRDTKEQMRSRVRRPHKQQEELRANQGTPSPVTMVSKHGPFEALLHLGVVSPGTRLLLDRSN